MKTETIYTVLITLVTTLAALFLAGGRELALLDIVLVKAVSVAVFLVFTFSLLFVLRGTRYDSLKEIYEDDKGAAAIFTGLLLVALALVVGK